MRSHTARHRRRLAAATVLAGTAAALLLGQSSADAGSVHAIQTANSPFTGLPATGGGSWIVNKPSGYYLGRAVVGSSFDDEVTSSANWHYGRAIDGVNMCGWVMPGSMGASRGTTSDSCSSTTQSQLTHRVYIGKDFNGAAHATDHGTNAPANPACTVYFNYFYGTDFTANGGHFANPAGPAAATVGYRFTTRDGQAVVVQDPNLGWGFLPIGCLQRPATLYNDDDVP
ncbi:MAG: hypothetical protein ACR2N4_10225 [Jatrophihabitans sp.]